MKRFANGFIAAEFVGGNEIESRINNLRTQTTPLRKLY